MTKYYLESVPLSFSEVIEAKSEKCKCGKKSTGLLKESGVEHVICYRCAKSFIADNKLVYFQYIPWRFINFNKVRMRMKTFDHNCHL